MIAIVDTGPLLASVDASDLDHERSIAALERPELQLAIPALVVAEATHMIGMRLGPRVEGAFLRTLKQYAVEAPASEDWSRIADLVDEYADFPLGGTDASVVVLAERLETDVVITLDHRHFAAIKPRHCAAFRLLPE